MAISGGRWLHHTSLLWDFEPHNMVSEPRPSRAHVSECVTTPRPPRAHVLQALLKLPRKRPEYRADREHTQFLGKLNQVGPHRCTFPFLICIHICSETPTQPETSHVRCWMSGHCSGKLSPTSCMSALMCALKQQSQSSSSVVYKLSLCCRGLPQRRQPRREHAQLICHRLETLAEVLVTSYCNSAYWP